MSDEVTDKIIEELAKQIPIKQVYGDLASPATKEVGKSLTDIVKVLRLVLAPIQLVAALQDRFERFLDRAVRQIPEARRITPAPQMLGPILEAIRYEPELTPIDEMFSQLLSGSMDKERVDRAHPAFIEIIKQLSSDEAVLLASIATGPRRWYVRQLLDFSGQETLLDEHPMGGLVKPQNFELYLLHLGHLGLVTYYDLKAPEPEYEPTPQRQVDDLIYPASRVQVASKVFKELKLTPWGDAFMRACSAL
jgi:Abortive infection alpha